MSMMEQINSLVRTMQEEKHQFENIQNDVQRCEADVQRNITNLSRQVRSLINNSQADMDTAQNTETAKIFESASEILQGKISEANEQIQEAVKGMSFIEEFERSFVVAVFGKVKAGKSYIGNFIMGKPLRGNDIESAYNEIEPPIVHVYDRGKLSTQDGLAEMDEETDFATGMKETTSTIQWFELGGMSWFDTPGIGSVTWENEMLAKEYVKNADLVVFCSNSDAAGTRQDFAEMRQLYDMKKPLLLLLTQSDTYEYDVDDEGEEISVLVPKTDKDRADTEAYMKETLAEQGMSDILKYDILTVSAKLAVEALQRQDETLFEQSNMGQFLDKLVAITKNEAADIKKATPRRRLNEMIVKVTSDMQQMANEIDAKCREIEESKRDLENRNESILAQVKQRAYIEMLKIVHEFKVKVEENGVTVSEEELSSEINKAVGKCITQVFAEESIKAAEQAADLNIALNGIGDLKMKKDSIAYEHHWVEQVRRDPKGIWENLGSFFMDKKYYTSKTRSETRYSTFDIGVNDNEITEGIMYKLEDAFRNTINQYITDMVTGYYQPIEKLQQNSIRAIDQTIRELEALKR